MIGCLLGVAQLPLATKQTPSFDFTVSDMPVFDEETDDPHYADARNFYMVQTWTKDGYHLTDMLYAGNNLEKAYDVFRAFTKKWPRSRVTIRQRTRVIAEWPVKSGP